MKVIDIVSFALAVFFISALSVLLIYAVGTDDSCPNAFGNGDDTFKIVVEAMGLLFIAYAMGNFIMPVYDFIKRIIILFIRVE